MLPYTEGKKKILITKQTLFMVAFLFLKSKINFDFAVFESNLKFEGEKFNISASKNINIILTWPVKCRNIPKTCTHINDLNPHSNLQRKKEKCSVVISRKITICLRFWLTLYVTTCLSRTNIELAFRTIKLSPNTKSRFHFEMTSLERQFKS